MSRSFDESMSELTGYVERYPGSELTVRYAVGTWVARCTLFFDGEETGADSYTTTEIARSCEAEKALDSLATKMKEVMT